MNPKPFSALNHFTVPLAGPPGSPLLPYAELLRSALVEAAVAAPVGDRGEVHEDVGPTVVGLDEPEALLRVEPLHRAVGRTAGLAALALRGAPPICPRRGCGSRPGRRSRRSARRRRAHRRRAR